MNIRETILFLLCTFLFGSCVTRKFPLTKDDPVSRDQAILILSVDYLNEFNLPPENKIIRYLASDFYDPYSDVSSDQQLFEVNNINDVRLYLEGTNDDQLFFYFPKNRSQQKYVAIAMTPGSYSVKAFRFISDQIKLNGRGELEKEIDFVIFYNKIPNINFTLEAGKVHYLGNFTLRLESKMRELGFLPPRIRTEWAKVRAFHIDDNMEEAKEYFAKNMPWFPFGEPVNLAKPLYLKRVFMDWEVTDKPKIKEDQSIERDKTKFFY